MRYSEKCLPATLSILAAAGLLIQAPNVIAEEKDDADEVTEVEEVVVVEAPLIRRTEVSRPSSTGMRTEIIELSRRVSYADLDLTKPSDVVELENRIRDVAEENCEKLDEMFPFADADHRGLRRCERLAVRRAEAEFEAAVAAAN